MTLYYALGQFNLKNSRMLCSLTSLVSGDKKVVHRKLVKSTD